MELLGTLLTAAPRPDVNRESTRDNGTPLVCAAYAGKPDAVKALIKAGAEAQPGELAEGCRLWLRLFGAFSGLKGRRHCRRHSKSSKHCSEPVQLRTRLTRSMCSNQDISAFSRSFSPMAETPIDCLITSVESKSHLCNMPQSAAILTRSKCLLQAEGEP